MLFGMRNSELLKKKLATSPSTTKPESEKKPVHNYLTGQQVITKVNNSIRMEIDVLSDGSDVELCIPQKVISESGEECVFINNTDDGGCVLFDPSKRKLIYATKHFLPR